MDLYKEKRVKMTIVDLVYFIRLKFKMIFEFKQSLLLFIRLYCG